MGIDKSNWGHEQGSPSNTEVEVKEMNAEDNYYQYADGNFIAYEVSEYVEALERKLKSEVKHNAEVKRCLKEMLAAMKKSRPDDLGCFKSELDRLISLKPLIF